MITLQNPGEIEIDLLKTMGVNVKIDDDTIGYFGTGLKYAIAVFLRENIDFKLFIGNNEYTFYKTEKVFRGKTFEMCCMNGPVDNIELNFAVSLGKNWDLWQAYREIHSNCLDENGTIVEDVLSPKDGHTTFIIDNKDKFQIRDVFLNWIAPVLLFKNDDVEIYDGESEVMYYKGIRAKDLSNTSRFTYNILKDCTLTEDRLLCYDFQVKEIINKAVVEMASYNPEIMSEIVTTDYQKFEGQLSMEYNTNIAPTQEFIDEVVKLKTKTTTINQSVTNYITKHAPKRELTPQEKRDEFFSELEYLCEDYDVKIKADDNQVLLIKGVLDVIEVEDSDE